MATRRLVAAALAGAALAAAGCGAPEELDDGEDRTLTAAREGLDDALDTEEAIRTSPALGRRLARRVERAGDDPKAVERLVPSLVDGGELDVEAVDAFDRYAGTDPVRALLVPAERAVDRMVAVIEDSGADGDTKIPSLNDRPLQDFADEVQRDIGDVWPELAEELGDAL